MILGRRARVPAAAEGGHGDTGHRGRLAFARPARESARAAVTTAARHLFALGHAEVAFRETRWRGSRLAWLEAGQGRPLLLLHGAGGGAANWFAVMARLARDNRVIAPDLPGFGLSDPLEGEGPLSLAALPAVLAVLDSAGAPQELDVCGTSYGGTLAFRLAQARARRVRRLALLEPAGLGREMPRRVRLAALPFLGGAILARPGKRGIRWELRQLTTSLRLPP
ncbi:MAG TPA: alpha/beta fold hydrolase, partial [Longimicrobiales bacterium]